MLSMPWRCVSLQQCGSAMLQVISIMCQLLLLHNCCDGISLVRLSAVCCCHAPLALLIDMVCAGEQLERLLMMDLVKTLQTTWTL